MILENKTLLTVIDVQGKLADLMVEKDSLFLQLRRIIQGVQLLGMPILWLEQLPEKLGPTRPEIEPLLRETGKPIAKTPFSAWASGEYRQALETSRRTHVLLCGIEAHICVYQTARDLLERGYEVTLLEDCVSSRTRENRATGIAAVRDMGGWISCVETVLFEILRTPEHPAFREISRIIK